jgi:hypothetical protein
MKFVGVRINASNLNERSVNNQQRFLAWSLIVDSANNDIQRTEGPVTLPLVWLCSG